MCVCMDQRGFVGGLKLATCSQLHSVQCTQQHICCVCMYQECSGGSLSWLPCPHQPAWRHSAAGGHPTPRHTLGSTKTPSCTSVPLFWRLWRSWCLAPSATWIQKRCWLQQLVAAFTRQLQPDPTVAVLACMCAGLVSLLVLHTAAGAR